MLAAIGTVPEKDFPLIHGRAMISNNQLVIKGQKISINRGTPALLAAAVKTSEVINGPDVYAFLI
ncbi:MAG: sugar kinase, partial [candidate division KSB1 bacterium]|nr:sugar kinase [candidate division KSB1 bacterium]